MSTNPYPHLKGDLDANPRVLTALEKLARRRGEIFTVTNGTRTIAEQRRLWDGAPANGLVRGLTVAAPGASLHQIGDAVDVTINGTRIQKVVSAKDLQAVGLYPLPWDSVHVQLYPQDTSIDAAQKLDAEWKLNHGNGPFGINTPGGVPGSGGPISNAVGAIGDAAGGAIGKGIDSAASATANAIVDVFAGWAKTDGLRALLYVVLVGGGVVLATVGTSRALGARREATG